MVETTVSVVPGKRPTVPRILKRTLQIAVAVALTAAALLAMIVDNGMVVERNASLPSGMNAWLAFIQRPDILAPITVIALVIALVTAGHLLDAIGSAPAVQADHSRRTMTAP